MNGTTWTADEVREALRAMLTYDHAEGHHDLREPVAGCPGCAGRRGSGHYELRRVNVCSRPEARFITTVKVWVRDPS